MATRPKYQLDLIFRRTLLLSNLYTKSWGNPQALKTIKYYREKYLAKGIIMELIERDLPKMIIIKKWKKNDVLYMEGYFKSPLVNFAPSLFPEPNVAIASWRGLFPANRARLRGLIIHLAGTGDHSFFRRERGLANDLLSDGIASILLENPFYGTRKPKNQFRSSLLNVSDLFVMGSALIAECCYLLRWAREWIEHDFSFSPSSCFSSLPMGLSGVSMGGHMASLAASNVPVPTALVPLLSWTSAAPVFTFGALSEAVNWSVLKAKLADGYLRELQRLMPDNDWTDKMNDSAYMPAIIEPARRLMWILMDEFTNLDRYPLPYDTSLVRSVIAEEDAYVLRHSAIPDLTILWPDARVNVVSGKGHVETYLTGHALFRETIRDALRALAERNITLGNTAASTMTMMADPSHRMLESPVTVKVS